MTDTAGHLLGQAPNNVVASRNAVLNLFEELGVVDGQAAAGKNDVSIPFKER